MKRLIILIILLAVSAGPMFRGLFFPYEMYLSLAIISGLCALYMILKVVKGEKLQLNYIILFAGVVLLLAYCLAFTKAVNVRGNIETLMQYVVYFMVLIVIYDYFHTQIDHIPWIAFAPMSIIGFLSAVVGLAGYTKVFSELDVTVNGQRIGSTLQYANTAAIYYLILIALATGFILNHKNIFVKGFFATISNVMFMTLFFTSSRGVFLVIPVIVFIILILAMPNGYRFKSFIYVLCVTLPTLTAMQGYEANSQINNLLSASKWVILSAGISAISIMLFSLLFRIRMEKKSSYVTIGVFILGMATALLVKWQIVSGFVLSIIPDNIIARIKDINFTTNSVVMRFEFYRDAIRLLKEHWLLGLGGGGFASLYQSVQELYYAARLVHNHYLQVFVEAGILGFLSFSIMVVAACIYLIYSRVHLKETKHKVYVAACFCAFISLAVHSAIDFNLSYASMSYLLFALMGISTAYFSYTGKELELTKEISEKQKNYWTKKLIPSLMILVCIPCIFLGVRYSKAAKFAAEGTEYKNLIEAEKALELYEMATNLDPMLASNHAEIADLSMWMAYTAQVEADKSKWMEKALFEGEEAIRLDRYYPYYNKIMTDIYLFDE
ncbi:MAG TPA: hypothetical protein DDZ89_19115, partial [Clostridiales bacterium]|nr:hypothetical protein [Clostridiales bacterium]